MDFTRFLAGRTRIVEFSGIRKYFELASKLDNPIDLSIGQPDYDVPAVVKQAAVRAIESGRNGYTPTAGLPELRDRIAGDLKRQHPFDGQVLITAGVSGGLTLSLLALIDPGDEVLFPDPYFVSYLHLVNMFGGRPVPIPSYPDFRLPADRIEAAIGPRTKAILLNSPANPTGRVMTEQEVRTACEIAERHNLILISDEIYDRLTYDGGCPSPMAYAPHRTILLRGFGKTYGMTGWRMGYAAGPAGLIGEMMKCQQYTFVCAPSPAQYAALAALDADVTRHRTDYTAKRDLVCDLLRDRFEFVRPGGGFYVFPRIPPAYDNGDHFVKAAIDRNLLIIPGGVFSSRNTHFRISYAASDERLRAGCRILCELADR